MNKQILFFYTFNNVGGTETNIIKIARELVIMGYGVHLAFLNEDGPLLDNLNFEISSITCIGNFKKHPFLSYKKYKQLIQKEHIDVVLNFGLKVECFSRLFAKKFGVKRIISNIRSTDNHRKWYHTLLDRLTQKNVDLWVSNSEAGKQAHHKREKVPNEKISVIYNFIDTYPKILHKEQSKVLRIGILANIFKRKGYFDTIPLTKILMEKGIEIKYIIGGVDKTNGTFLKELEKEKLLSYFKFKGYVSDKVQFFSEIDVFFLPSYLEGLPTVILEAMMFEKPIVASNIGGIPEVITDGETGYLFNPGNVDGFATGIINLLNEEQKEKIIRNAKRQVEEKFSKTQCMNKWINIIDNQ